VGAELTPGEDFYYGPGICFYADGTVYKGGWSEGTWGSGQGMVRALSGEILFGQFTGEKGRLKDMQFA
jgi:hypothetical protein